MTFFDLLFLVLFLTCTSALLVAGVSAIRGRRSRAGAILKACVIGAAVYFSVLVVVSVLTPQRYIGRGDDQCADDWCIAVSTIGHQAIAGGTRFDVTFRLSSRARRVAQRERFVVVYLRDSQGARYNPVVDPDSVPFDTLLEPIQSITTTRRFLVPKNAAIVGVVVAREGGGRFPGCCIIGDEGSLLHKRTIVRVE